jgi:hypothetical protein
VIVGGREKGGRRCGYIKKIGAEERKNEKESIEDFVVACMAW